MLKVIFCASVYLGILEAGFATISSVGETMSDLAEGSLQKRMQKIWKDNGHGYKCVCDECNIEIPREPRVSDNMDNIVTMFACLPCLACVDGAAAFADREVRERNVEKFEMLRKARQAKKKAEAEWKKGETSQEVDETGYLPEEQDFLYDKHYNEVQGPDPRKKTKARTSRN